jgi:zinc transporter ZupT
MGLAFGSLSAVVFLHLLPEVSEEFGGLTLDVAGTIFAGVAFGVLMEVTMSYFGIAHNHDGHGHGHGHDGDEEAQRRPSEITGPQTAEEGAVVVRGSAAGEAADDEAGTPSKGASEAEHQLGEEAVLLSLIADAFHNFVDGVIIGVAFFNSMSTGLTVTIGIILHELPQELGDFYILIDAGWSFQKAALWNVLVQSSSVVGGIAVLATIESGWQWHRWFLPVAMGQLLYVTLGHLLPETVREQRDKKLVLWTFLAMLIGAGIIAALTEFPAEHSHAPGSGAHAGHSH